MSVEVRIEPGRIARLLRWRGGRVDRKLRERTERVARIAQREAPGSMGDYIDWKVQQGPRGLEGVIVCDHPAVRFVLDGTRPHRSGRAVPWRCGSRWAAARCSRRWSGTPGHSPTTSWGVPCAKGAD